jgi:hypothetical protein
VSNGSAYCSADCEAGYARLMPEPGDDPEPQAGWYSPRTKKVLRELPLSQREARAAFAAKGWLILAQKRARERLGL